MKNKLKFIGILVVMIVLVSVGFGFGRWSVSSRVASLEARIEDLEKETEEKSCFTQEISPPETTRPAVVTYVVDGDTIEVDGEERIRYLGINTPESGRSYFTEATNENKRLVDGKEIKLELDVQTKDKYGRTLAYVWVGETMVNLELVCRGYANVYTFPPNVKYKDLFLEAEREARGSWYVGISQRGRKSWVMFNQARILDKKRLTNRIGTLDDKDFQKVKQRFLDFYST